MYQLFFSKENLGKESSKALLSNLALKPFLKALR